MKHMVVTRYKKRVPAWQKWYLFILMTLLFAMALLAYTPVQGDSAERETWVSVKATAYAPLDPRAKKGGCHNGNPHTVAYGRTNPNIDIAASWDFPKGAWVYIPTEFHGKPIGWRQVNDRFGSYEKTKHMRNRIDISMWRQSEAVGKNGWGTRDIKVLVRKGGKP